MSTRSHARIDTVPAATVRRAIAVAIGASEPTLVWGHPGEGKTATIARIADGLGRPLETVIGSLREATDFAGLPVRTDEGVVFAPPSWALRAAAAGNTIVFLDELTTCDPRVQAAMLRVTHERVVGELQLPTGVAMVAAANPPESAADGSDLAPSFANRFCHLTLIADPVEWARGLATGWPAEPVPTVPDIRTAHVIRWAGLVGDFVLSRRDLLRPSSTTAIDLGHAWQSPRTWHMAVRLAAAGDAAAAGNDVVAALVAGCVGPAAATELMSYVRNLDLPDPEALLADPTSMPDGIRGDQLFATVRSVVAAVERDLTLERWTAGLEVLAAAATRHPEIPALVSEPLVALRRNGWPAPRAVLRFLPLLERAGLVAS